LRPPVQFEALDRHVKRFLAFMRFDHRSNLDQLGIEIGSFDEKVS
jgi:hypothetical protein